MKPRHGHVIAGTTLANSSVSQCGKLFGYPWDVRCGDLAGGVPGSRYAFQSSGDLQTWLNLSTNTADATGQATFTDTNASNLHPFRFYRSLLLP